MKTWDLPKTEKEAIIFFQDKGLLPTRHRGTSRHHLRSYLLEIMWRAAAKTEGRPPFNVILNDISAFWVHNSKL